MLTRDGGQVFDAFISYSHAADGRLAPAIQSGLQRLAKKTFQRRALRVFRDETGLSTNPHLWDSIASAIADSEWFVLLASPESARSAWVDREVRTWLDTKPLDHILVVVTDGDLAFRPGIGVDRVTTTCLPEPLIDALTDEPRWLDLRWARTDTQLDLRNGRFRAAVADLAAPIHGVAKDDLEGEDVRQQKRAKRLATTGITAVALLAIASAIGAAIAIDQRSNAIDQRQEAATQRDEAAKQRDEASKQRDEADAQRKSADEQRQVATEQRDEAQAQRARADTASNTATARGLAAQATAVSPTDIDLGLLLAAEGYRREPSLDTQTGLVSALEQASQITELVRTLPSPVIDTAVTPDRTKLYALSASGEISELAIGTWTPTGPPIITGLQQPLGLMVSQDGRYLATADRHGATVVDLASGATIAAGVGGGALTSLDLNADGSLVVVGLLDERVVRVYELDGLRTVFELPFDGAATFLPNRRLAAQQLGSPGLAVYDLDAGTTPVVSRNDLPPGGGLALSPDGKYLLAGGLSGQAELVDPTTLAPGPTLSVRGSRTGDFFFSPNGAFVGMSSDDGSARVYDLASGTLVAELTGLTGALVSEFVSDGEVLSAGYYDDTAALWRAGPGASIGTTSPSGDPSVRGLEVIDSGQQVVMALAGSVSVRPIAHLDSPTATRATGLEARSMDVSETAGLVAVYSLEGDPATQEVTGFTVHVMRLPDLEPVTDIVLPGHASNVAFSPDGALLAVGESDGTLVVFESRTGRQVLAPTPADTVPYALALLVWNTEGTRLHTGGQDGTLRTFETTTWTIVSEHVLAADGSALRFGRLSPDGRLVVVPIESGAVFLVDSMTGAPVGDPFIAAGTQLQNAVLMNDGKTLAALSRDGTLRLWDVTSHLAIGPALTGHVDFALALAPVSSTVLMSGGAIDGQLIEWNLDPQSWATKACALAGRNFTRTEWDRYVGGDYHVTCPAFPEGA